MFAGHYAVAFGAKAAAPTVPLGVLFVAAQAADIVQSVLLLAGLESVEIDPEVRGQLAVTADAPYSHGIVGTALLAVIGVLATRRWCPAARWRGALLVGTVVAAHPLLDLLHLDAFGLWVVETALYVAGCCVLYLRARSGPRVATVILMLALLGFSVVVATSSPPSSVSGLALANLAAYGVLAAIAARLDRQKRPAARLLGVSGR